MDYSYITKDQVQYEDYDLNNQNIVDAMYSHALVNEDKGSPYIEALPLPRSDEELQMAYTTTLPSFRYDKVKDMSNLKKLLAVGNLRKLRFPLPFHEELEFEFYNALLTSYRSRKRTCSVTSNVFYYSQNERQDCHSVLLGDSAEATNAGFSLIGYSGCGKSSAIKTLISHYPQVIMHHIDEFERFPQIVYLVVNCVANSNFSALYEGIGDAIDKALGNIEPVYAKEISKEVTLGKKAEKIKQLVERFGIGIIIFDEIQLIDFSHTKENTFDSLMTLSNRTKVAIAVVGTEDAKDKMFKELRTSRRIGVMIKGDTYCSSKKYFAYIVNNVFAYQWFDEPIKVSEDIVDTLYDLSNGIVDQLIGIYMCMHYEYFRKKTRPKITPDYIRSVANKYYPNIQQVLKETKNKEEELAKIKMNAKEKASSIIDKARQEEAENKLLNSSSKQIENRIQLSNIVSNITAMYDFKESEIEEAYKKVASKQINKDKTEKELSRLTLEQLNKTVPKKRTAKAIKPTVNQMRDFLGLDKE